MHAESLLTQVLIYLAAMVVTVPIAKRAGLGAVLGYLIVGALMGPFFLGWIGADNSGALHLAEFGVIMMLFLIGLELQPAVLWKLRGPIFGLGGLQVAVTSLVVAAIAWGALGDWKPGLAIGMILAMSSTAIVLQTLQEKGLIKRTGGEAAFSVLLFQDIAVIPILAIFPFLAVTQAAAPAADAQPAWMQFVKVLAAVAVVIAAGRYLLRPVFRVVAMAKLRELFTAMALLLVFSTTALMQAAGLSPALGAFLAGVVLADSEYRHQLEVDIEPFKGLLLGVFFISVGSGIDFGLVRQYPGWTALIVLGIVAIKWIILLALSRVAKMSKPDSLLFAFSLAQGGEFAFVLLNYTRQLSILPTETSQLLTAAVALSMMLAPLLIGFYAKVVEPKLAAAPVKRAPDEIDEKDSHVIVAGIGRFGQTITRLLRASGYKVTVLDYDADQVDMIRRFGSKSFFGDASSMDLLHAAGAAEAKILAIAIDDYEKTLQIVDEVKSHFPRIKILARAYDRVHAYKLIHRGVTDVYIETSGSALSMGQDALKHLGMPAHQAFRTSMLFKKTNDRSIQEAAKVFSESDEAALISQAKGWLEELEKMLRSDQAGIKGQSDSGWEAPHRV